MSQELYMVFISITKCVNIYFVLHLKKKNKHKKNMQDSNTTHYVPISGTFSHLIISKYGDAH